MIFGAGLSPTVFRLFGFYGNYIVRYADSILVYSFQQFRSRCFLLHRFVFYGGALAYLSFCVEEPVKDRKVCCFPKRFAANFLIFFFSESGKGVFEGASFVLLRIHRQVCD